MSETLEVDYLILGAGPAGLQLGYYLDRARRRYVLLEEGDSPGTFFKTMPRHRRLLSINKIHTGHDDPELNLRWDWNSLLTDDYEPTCQSLNFDFHAFGLRTSAGRIGCTVSRPSEARYSGKSDWAESNSRTFEGR